MLALSLPRRALADVTYAVGSVSGRDDDGSGRDKFERHGIVSFDGPVSGLPLVVGDVAFFCELVSARADPRVFAAGRWSLRDDNTELHTLHHLGGGLFALPAQTLQAQLVAFQRIQSVVVLRLVAVVRCGCSACHGWSGRSPAVPAFSGPRSRAATEECHPRRINPARCTPPTWQPRMGPAPTGTTTAPLQRSWFAFRRTPRSVRVAGFGLAGAGPIRGCQVSGMRRR